MNQERERRCEEASATEMTKAVATLGMAYHFTRGTTKQAWATEIERLATEAKRVRDAMYAEQGPLQYADQPFAARSDSTREGK